MLLFSESISIAKPEFMKLGYLRP